MSEMISSSSRGMLSNRSSKSELKSVKRESDSRNNMSQNSIMNLMSNATSNNTMMTDAEYLPYENNTASDAYQLANDNSGSVSVSYQQDH